MLHKQYRPLYINGGHVVARKLSRISQLTRKFIQQVGIARTTQPRKFSTVNDLHYTVCACVPICRLRCGLAVEKYLSMQVSVCLSQEYHTRYGILFLLSTPYILHRSRDLMIIVQIIEIKHYSYLYTDVLVISHARNQLVDFCDFQRLEISQKSIKLISKSRT